MRGFYTRGSRSLLFFPCSEHGGIQRVEMSLKFFAGTVVCHESKAVSTDHLHFVLICSSNVANGLGFLAATNFLSNSSRRLALLAALEGLPLAQEE